MLKRRKCACAVLSALLPFFVAMAVADGMEPSGSFNMITNYHTEMPSDGDHLPRPFNGHQQNSLEEDVCHQVPPTTAKVEGLNE